MTAQPTIHFFSLFFLTLNIIETELMLKVLIKVQMGYESLEFMSEFSYHKGIQFFIQAV